MRGYQTFTPLTEEDTAIIPVFIMLRRMLLTAWIASHSETPTPRQLGPAYTEGTVRLARDYLAGRSVAGLLCPRPAVTSRFASCLR
jgi:Ser/Thr protein kinase RdoA (MazF antagonist)